MRQNETFFVLISKVRISENEIRGCLRSFSDKTKPRSRNHLLLFYGRMIMSKEWWKCAGIRAGKTVCQTAVAMIGTSVLMTDVNWMAVLSASVLAGILSLLTSLAGLPEVEEKKEADHE